jgi:hypothetical protein
LLSDPSCLLSSGRADDQQPQQKRAKTVVASDDGREQLKISARLRHSQKRRLNESASDNNNNNNNGGVMESEIPANGWTMESLVMHLLRQALSPRWEVRHGALNALCYTARTSVSPSLSCALADRALHVLALERFNDYSTDRVISPVREAAATLLGVAMTHVPAHEFAVMTQSLLKLTRRPEWEVRHAGLLGLRCAVSTHVELVRPHVSCLISPLLAALSDADDDVIAVAAEVVLPIASDVARVQLQDTAKVLDLVWDLLESLDDLSASLACLLQLLSAFYIIPEVAEVLNSCNVFESHVSLLTSPTGHQSPSSCTTSASIASPVSTRSHFSAKQCCACSH